MTYTHEQIAPFLKLSKSEQADNGPYTLKRFAHADWADIIDKTGQTVGQVSGLEFVTRGLRYQPE